MRASIGGGWGGGEGGGNSIESQLVTPNLRPFSGCIPLSIKRPMSLRHHCFYSTPICRDPHHNYGALHPATIIFSPRRTPYTRRLLTGLKGLRYSVLMGTTMCLFASLIRCGPSLFSDEARATNPHIIAFVHIGQIVNACVAPLIQVNVYVYMPTHSLNFSSPQLPSRPHHCPKVHRN